MANGERNDPIRNFNFLLEIDGITQARFTECSGFNSEVEVVDYREGGEAINVRKLPGKVTYGDITLKWGRTDSTELYKWHKTAVGGKVERKNGGIVLLDEAGEEKARWSFFEGWASKWEGASLNSTGSEVAVESLTITCERLETV